MIACTYTYGLVEYGTEEVGIVREQGVWPRYNAARLEDAAELALVAGLVDPAVSSWVVWLQPLVTSVVSGATVRSLVDATSDDGLDGARTYYQSGAWHTDRLVGGVGAPVSVAQDLDLGAPIVVYGGADDAHVVVAANGSEIASAANTNDDAVVTGTVGLGYSRLLGQQGDFRIAGAAFFTRLLTRSEWLHFSALRRPPAFGEAGTGDAMRAVYIAGDSIIRYLPDGGTCVDLNGGDVTLRSLTGAGPGPSVHQIANSPFRNGGIYLSTLGAIRPIVAAISAVSDVNPTTIWDIRRALAHGVNPRRGLGVLQLAPDAVLYEIDAILAEDGSAFGDQRGPHLMNAEIPFTCPGPDWRGVVRGGYEAVIPGAGWSLPWDFDPGWEFSEAKTEDAIENIGDVLAYPVVTFIAGSDGATAPEIVNETTGERFAMRSTFAMTAGQELIVDMSARTVLLDGVNAMGERDPSTSMFALALGDNTISIDVASGGVTVAVRYTPQYTGV